MQEVRFGNNKNSTNVPSHKTFREFNSFLAPQVESHLIDQVGDLCSAAGKTLSKTGGRYGKLFKAVGSIAKITGTSGKVVLQSASKVSKLPVAPAAGVVLNLSQLEELHNSSSIKYNDFITNGVNLVKEIIENIGFSCIEATQSLFEILFGSNAESDQPQVDLDSITLQDCAEITGNVDAEEFFNKYSL